ncbi:SPX domain-containing protein [Helicostylum pulchrum]|nr:SPX domain-containing protein [Helicostylum pulchrum]
MKFSHSIILNAVPEWLDQYVDYDRLKKIVYQAESDQVNKRNANSKSNLRKAEEGRIFTKKLHHVSDTTSSDQELHNRENEQFLLELDLQLDKVLKFFPIKVKEYLQDSQELDSQFATFNIPLDDEFESAALFTNPLEALDSESPARIMHVSGLQSGRRRGSQISVNQAHDIEEFNMYYNFRVRCAATYISLTELKSYVDINRTAFDKILKKWDKVTDSHLREAYFSKIVKTAEPFSAENFDRIDNTLEHVLNMYAAVFTNGKKHLAEVELKMHIRDHVIFERSTVWKDLVGKERQTMDAHASIPLKGFRVPYLNMFISHKTMYNIFGFLLALTVYIVLMYIDTMNQKEASKCLALLLFAALMWAFECIPLFATAFLVPLLVVPMHICRDGNGNILPASDAAKLVFKAMFSDTIMVLLGGFSIAAALSKHGVAKAFASTILSKAGSKPRYVILVNMYLATFLCMWISNVATPVLCFSLVEPILRTLRSNSTVAPSLVLGIALASCIGGLASPISSPQNIIAINLMDPSPGWGIWFAGALPCGIITVFTTWVLILLYFRPDNDTPHLNVIKSQGFSRPTRSQAWVSIVCLSTIALWCAETSMNEFWGDNGVIAAIPFVLLFATNMLNKNDLNNFLWSVVTLAQGGMALGFAVESSGLLDIIGHRIATNVGHLSDLAIIFVFGFLVLVFATFVSHTVAALIILPIVKQVGENLPISHPNLLVMVTVLVCSVAMGLPVSGFPNMNAIMLEDPTGKPYLKIKDFLLCGVPSSILAAIITICLGYGIISGIGF